jgi:hypothetical protein
MILKSFIEGMIPVKNKITRNVNLDRGEVIQKEFKNLKVKNKVCSMLLTDRRLIVYTFGPELVKGRRVKRRIMNEIDLKSIHRFEYFYEFQNRSVVARVIGFIAFVIAAVVAYSTYSGLAVRYFPSASPYGIYLYGAALFLAVVGLSVVFATDKKLVLQIRSGMEEKTDLLFYPNKANEFAIRFIAGRIHPR